MALSPVAWGAARALHRRGAPVACPPAAGVPVPAVGLVAAAVDRPGHDVRHAGPDVLHAARAAVRLGRRPAKDRPHPPLAVLPLLLALDALADPFVGQRRGRRYLGAAAGMITAGTHTIKRTRRGDR